MSLAAYLIGVSIALVMGCAPGWVSHAIGNADTIARRDALGSYASKSTPARLDGSCGSGCHGGGF